MMSDRLEKGQLLKQTREAKGISLDTIHEATKIPLDALKAIEEGYKVRTLTDFYYRAFVKLYANYLELDLSVVIDDYKPEKIPEPTKFHRGRTLWDDDSLFHLSRKQMRQIVKWTLVAIAVLLLIRIVGCVVKKASSGVEASKKISQPIASKKKVIKKKEIVIPSAPVEEKAKPETIKKASAVTPAVKVTKRVNLVVRAQKASWLLVKVDGEVVFRGTFTRGTTESWQANDKIELSGKNIKELELELNGRILTSLGNTTRNIKSIVVTKSGFYIKD
ncbi:MAG: DUF4115 domain-containing protein [Candidatus Aceula meridiana]|nr:DUF4115 domain-containing protein [Candidatus Aceula meridiana]